VALDPSELELDPAAMQARLAVKRFYLLSLIGSQISRHFSASHNQI